MNERSKRPSTAFTVGTRIGASLLGVVLLAGLALAAGPSNPEKLSRQIGIMERTIDKILVDSPNFLVTSGRNACGFYFDGLGVVFTFNTRLVDEWSSFGDFFDPGSDVTVTRDKDGQRQIIIRRNHGKHSKIGHLLGFSGNDRDEVRDTIELYESGKEELVEALLDEGETLSAMPSGQYVILCARLDDNDLRREKKISRLMVKAKIDDLKAYADDKLSESEMKSRIVTEES